MVVEWDKNYGDDIKIIFYDRQPQIDEVGEMVQKLVRVFQLFERDYIKIHGFTTSQCYTMIEIYKSGHIAMGALSEKMNLDISTMTRIVDKLVRDRYITRNRDELDRRIVVLSHTEKGKSAVLALKESVNSYYRKIIENIPQDRFDDIQKSVRTLLNAFEKANLNRN